MSQSTTRLGQRRRVSLSARLRISPPARVRPGAPADERRDRQFQPGDRAARERLFRRRHLLEIHGLQPLGGRDGKARVDDDLRPLGRVRRRGRRRLGAREQCLRRPALGRRGVWRGIGAPHHRQHQAHHLLEEAGVAPVEPEHLREDRAMLGATDETGLQDEAEILAAGKARRLDGPDRPDHPARPHRQAGGPERPGEMRDIRDEPPVRRDRQVGEAGHQAGTSAARAASRIRPASDPCRRAMSS